jgi:hypothetical protein
MFINKHTFLWILRLQLPHCILLLHHSLFTMQCEPAWHWFVIFSTVCCNTRSGQNSESLNFLAHSMCNNSEHAEQTIDRLKREDLSWQWTPAQQTFSRFRGGDSTSSFIALTTFLDVVPTRIGGSFLVAPYWLLLLPSEAVFVKVKSNFSVITP